MGQVHITAHRRWPAQALLAALLCPLPVAVSAQAPQQAAEVKPPVTDDPLMQFIYRAAWVHKACLQRYPQQALRWQQVEQQLLDRSARNAPVPEVDLQTIKPLSIQHCEYEMALWSALDYSDAHVLAEFLEEVAYQGLDASYLDNPERLVLGVVFMPFGVPTVSDLHPDGPAWLAGIKPTDQLLAIDGVRIASTQGFYVQMAKAVPGRALPVVWMRESARGMLQYEALVVPQALSALSPGAF